jgi:hypothetical protein
MKLKSYNSKKHDIRPLVEGVYGAVPDFDSDELNGFCVILNEELVGFGNLLTIEGISIGMTDWISLDPSLSSEERREALRLMIDHLRTQKASLGLDAIMIHSPYEEIRDLQKGSLFLQKGETVKRLVYRSEV